MPIRYSTSPFRASLPFCLAALLASSLTGADEIYDAQLEPATTAQAEFIERIITDIDSSVPAIDGWTRSRKATVTGNVVNDGERPLIDVRLKEAPLGVAVRLDFKSITADDRRKAGVQRSAEELQEELMAAAMSGDAQKMDVLQQELAALMQAQMEGSSLGQAAGMTPARPTEERRSFYVNVVVNGDGETIGKKYDIDRPGVARAFRIDPVDPDQVHFEYYLGAWVVSEFDPRNWRVAPPADYQNAASHLRALTALVTVSGDRRSVENYINETLDLNALNQMVD